MNHYHHLTLLEREKILFFSGKGYSLSRIAEEVGRSKATISRELRRNSQREEYIPLIAEQKYEKRRKKCRRRKRLADPVLYVQSENKVSPGFGGRKYSYRTDLGVAVGDVVKVPTSGDTGIAKVTDTNVPESAVAPNILPLLKTVTEFAEMVSCRFCSTTMLPILRTPRRLAPPNGKPSTPPLAT